MSDFIVSARKYRPETFKSVVGQQSITGTLKNAIKNNHLGHAYLFCGPRGVGKTTCARIFAKTINCANPTSDIEPCNECESCMAFNESRSYNIHELDAASNNSVDDIRTLTEQVRIPPQVGKFSVYIIDEVHMLSQSAFNAFLKTLEEPPSHAVFILATTEKHKIIPTILSRCQIFDFNRIKVDDAVNYLDFISQKENIEYEEEALHVIAQKADGAMRDALSIFDQIVSFSGKNITYQNVIDNLNILDYEYYFRVTDHFMEGNVSESLLIFDEVIDAGFDGHNFITGLASHLRDLLVSTDPATVKLLEVSDSLRKRYLEQSKKCDPVFLFKALEICNQADLHYKASRNQRLLIELTLVKLARIADEKKKPDNEIKESVEREAKEELKASPATNNRQSELVPEKKAENRKVSTETEPSQSTSKSHKRNVVSGTGISIRDALNGNGKSPEIKGEKNSTDNKAIEEEKKKEDQDFDEDMLFRSWENYAIKLKQDRPRLYTTLSTRKPVLHSGCSINISFHNSDQRDDFTNNVKHFLLNHLKRELKNSKITIETSLEEDDSNSRKLYTPEDKFKYLNKKNPILGKLKQDFNLDFD